MKRVYEKPEIVFESFSLSTNIAGDCEHKTQLQTEGSCGYELRGGDVVFISELTGCTTWAQVDVDAVGNAVYNNRICYHVPTETTELFNS